MQKKKSGGTPRKGGKVLLYILGVLLFLGLVGSCMGDGEPQASPTVQPVQSETTSAPTPVPFALSAVPAFDGSPYAIDIDYASGDSRRAADAPPEPTPTPEPVQESKSPTASTSYIGNKSTKKFHYPYCASVKQMKESNKYYFDGTRDQMISKGYVPCKKCNP